MKTATVFWRDGELIVRCPFCKREDEGGMYLAAHADEANRDRKNGGPWQFTCLKTLGKVGDPTRLKGCGKTAHLGRIPNPPKAKGVVR